MNDVLSSLSSHLFWNCDVNNLDYKKNKRIVIERIIKYGLEKDIIVMWKIYSYRTIKKTAINIDVLEYERILYFSSMLNIKKEDFKCYKNNRYQKNY